MSASISREESDIEVNIKLILELMFNLSISSRITVGIVKEFENPFQDKRRPKIFTEVRKSRTWTCVTIIEK